MDADQPCLEVGEYEMDDRQEIFGHFRIATFGNIVGVVAALAQSGVAAPIVRRAYRPTFRLSWAVLGFRWRTSTEHRRQEPCDGRPGLRHGSGRRRRFHQLRHADQAGRRFLIGPHNASAQLVENAEGRLVARQPELPLKLHGGYSRCLAGDQIGRPEPDIQRRMAALHDGAHQKTSLATTCSALQNARPGCEKAPPRRHSVGRRSCQPSGRVPDRPREPRQPGKAAGTPEGIAGRPDRPFDGHPCRSWRVSPVLFVDRAASPTHKQTLALGRQGSI
jgi:hypothetical protein